MNLRRLFVHSAAGALFAAGLHSAAWAHPGHLDANGKWVHEDHDDDSDDDDHDAANTITLAQGDSAVAKDKVSGQGDLKFKVFATAGMLPPEAGPVLVKAHGGFAVDRRDGHGETYFALPGAGIIQLSADLSKSTLIPTPPEARDTNLHNTMIWYGSDGTPYLAFPANDAHKVFTMSIDGKLLHTLDPPQNVEFDEPIVKKYFADGGAFVPTDVEHLNSVYYITTGYSNLDWVLTANVMSAAPMNITWRSLAFGGRGEGPGQLGTGHGITVSPDKKVLNVADRPHSEIDRYAPDGKYLATVNLPKGSLPCDVAFESGYAVVGCLEGPDKKLGAPIYIMKDDKVVSTIMPKEDLGLEKFIHVHNAIMIKVNDRFYIIAQAWNPGDFAVFEQVKA